VSFIEQLLMASKRHGVTCVVIGESNGDGGDEDYEHTPPPMPETPHDPEHDDTELQQLRAQVQQLTAQLNSVPQPQPPTMEPAQGADNGSSEDQAVDTLGLEDEKLTRKVVRMGYDTVGKLRAAHGQGAEGPFWADGKAMLKKDWLIDIGIKLANAGPAPSTGQVPVVAATAPAAAVPGGHVDRPWEERLGLAKQKQESIDGLREDLTAKNAEVAAHTKKGEDIPDELDEEVLKLEDDIALVEAQLVAMRWCLGLNPDKAINLDEALEQANLGPWKSDPQPRLTP